MSSLESPPQPRKSPAWVINLALGVALAFSVLLIGAAQALPALPFVLEVEGARVVTAAFAEDGRRSQVTALRTPGRDAEPFTLRPVDLIEEPDVLGSWEELNEFYARQGELWKRLQGESVELRVAGIWRSVPVVKRGLADLPLAFYTMLVATLVVWVVGFATYALSDRGLAARIYAVSAVAVAVAVWPAALYATRPLALAPELFRVLSTVDHAGGYLFPAGCIGLVLVYPVRLMKFIGWLWALGAIATLAGHFQWASHAIAGFYTFNAVQFAMFLGFAFWQWRASRHDPVHRAALGWVLLSMFVGVIAFFALITVPVLFGQPPTISQTTAFVGIVLMYAGISLGVLRFRLFELDRWWFRTWSWILSGALVVTADLALMRLFDLERDVALMVALLVVGWIYFPIRQRLFERFGRVGAAPREYDARKLVTAQTHQELRARFREALVESFAPLEIVEEPALIDGPRLSADGAWLEVPSPTGDGHFRCHFRANGAHLFSREDVAHARDLSTLSESVRVALEARELGETAERTRIRRDLHDDLGASIIRIAHEASDERTARLAKAAMRDLRDILTALEEAPRTCADVLAELEADLRERAHAEQRQFDWRVRGGTEHVLDGRTRANLTRALRESMTNALKHGTGPIRYDLAVDQSGLRVTVENAFSASTTSEPGMGMSNISARLAELRGRATFAQSNDAFRLTLELPWSAEP